MRGIIQVGGRRASLVLVDACGMGATATRNSASILCLARRSNGRGQVRCSLDCSDCVVWPCKLAPAPCEPLLEPLLGDRCRFRCRDRESMCPRPTSHVSSISPLLRRTLFYDLTKTPSPAQGTGVARCGSADGRGSTLPEPVSPQVEHSKVAVDGKGSCDRRCTASQPPGDSSPSPDGRARDGPRARARSQSRPHLHSRCLPS